MNPRIGFVALRSRAMNAASYYLMKDGFILRTESPFPPSQIPMLIKANFFDNTETVINQDQANHRVAIFRDEILEMTEYEQRVFGIVQ